MLLQLKLTKTQLLISLIRFDIWSLKIIAIKLWIHEKKHSSLKHLLDNHWNYGKYYSSIFKHTWYCSHFIVQESPGPMYTITYIEYSFVTVRAFLKYGRFDGFSFRVGSRYIWSVVGIRSELFRFCVGRYQHSFQTHFCFGLSSSWDGLDSRLINI